MQLLGFNKYRFCSVFRHFTASLYANTKSFSTNQKSDSLNITENAVIISQSHDIFENLSLEDWLYKNYDMTAKNISILLLWYNGPSVVIGRHQNPWVECSVRFCEANGINVVRRNSGGGTVYHDFGNLNLSFLTSRKDYNRKRNLELICESVRRRWSVDLKVSPRDDILYKNTYKTYISGTAAKLGRNSAYHHCTVLVNVDETKLRQALHRENLERVDSKATSSVRSKVINLSSIRSDIDTINVIKAVAENYRQFYEIEDTNVFCIKPNEKQCPGIEDIIEGLKSWEWRFGRTPRFTVIKTFPLSVLAPQTSEDSASSNLTIEINVNKGVVENISLKPQFLLENNFSSLSQCIIGCPFSIEMSAPLEKWLISTKDNVLSHFVKNCILQMVLDVCR